MSSNSHMPKRRKEGRKEKRERFWQPKGKSVLYLN
jgi:hypothetical protein